MRKTPEGFLLCLDVPIARTGLQEYAASEVPIDPDETSDIVKIQRDATEVFRPETLASFEGKPVTLGHPDDMVSPKTWAQLAKGVMQNVRRGEGEFNNSLIADLLITDEEAIRKVEMGLREVSCGYEADYIQTGAGAGRQANIIGNHLALVPEGRAGSGYAIKDHKGVNMSLKDKLSKIFDSAGIAGKVKEDALKAVATKDDGVGTEVMSDAASQIAGMKDSLDKMCDAINKMTSGGNQPTKQGDVGAAGAGAEKEEKPAQDEGTKGIMDALKALGDRMDAFEKGKAGDEEEETEEESEETEEEESEDAEGSMVGDEKSRVEILAPGKKFAGKDAKAKALKAAWATTDGKAVIEVLNGNKEPDWSKKKTVDHLFMSASEVLKIKRSKTFPGSKQRFQVKDGHIDGDSSKVPSVDEINAKNAKFYSEQQRSQ